MTDKQTEDYWGSVLKTSGKKKGFSRDPAELDKSAEKIANMSLVFAVLSVVFAVVGAAGETVSSLNHLGFAGVMIAGLPQFVGLLGTLAAAMMAVVAIVAVLNLKRRGAAYSSNTIWTAAITLIIVAIRVVVILAPFLGWFC